PAACCGLVGMKPTRDLVSTVPADEGWLGLSVYGALARTVADSALMLDALADGSGPAGDMFRAAAAADPDRLRIAISRKLPPGIIAPISGDQRSAWERTGELLRELGHDVVERSPASGMASFEFTQAWIRGIYEDSLRIPDPGLLERSTRQMAAAGRRLVPERRRDRLRRKRERTASRILALWHEIDVLMTPVVTRTALAAEGGFGRQAVPATDRAARFTPWTPMFNLTGQPAVALPAGFGADGMPLSVQLVGRRGDESMLYSLAAQIEAARPWADRRPPL